MANRVCWSGDQAADSEVGVMTSRPTGYVGVVTSWPTVGLMGLMGQPTGYVGVVTRRLTVGLE